MMTDSEQRSATAERAWHEARVALKAAIERAERAEALIGQMLTALKDETAAGLLLCDIAITDAEAYLKDGER